MSSIQLFVGRLPREMDSSELEEIFGKYGKLARCDIKRGANLSFGFVEFEDSSNATAALESCNGMSVNGERMVVEIAKRSAKKRDDNSSACFRCGNEGHWARDCPESGRDDNGGRGDGRRRHRSRSPRRSHSGSRMRERGDTNRRHGGDRRDNGRGNRGRQGSRSRSPSRRGVSGRHHGTGRNERGSDAYGDRSNGRNRSPRRSRNNRGGSRSPRGRRESPPPSTGKRSGGRFEGRSGDSAVGNSPSRMDVSYE